jgi:hypothetical protein
MTISLAFLSPDLAKAAIDGRLPRGFGTKRMVGPVVRARARSQAAHTALFKTRSAQRIIYNSADAIRDQPQCRDGRHPLPRWDNAAFGKRNFAARDSRRIPLRRRTNLPNSRRRPESTTLSA